MSTGQHRAEASEGRVAPPAGGAPGLPSLQKDNCTRKGRGKAVFVAEENIRLYIEKFGVERVGLLTVTTPIACLLVSDFQRMWHSFLSHALKALFPSGIWIRERQPRSGNWHAHAVVNAGWDIKTGFPFDQVEDGFYANVPLPMRELWKKLREMAEAYGFGRTEFLPIKTSGSGCARYLTKYMAKAFGTEKSEGEEKCRLFGVWGGVRFVHSQFSFVSSRIIRRKLAWLAGELRIADYDGFKALYGRHWWHFIGSALREVILPEDDYKILINGELVWDDIGFRAYSQDILRFSGSPDDRVMQSHFYVFLAVGKLLFGRHEHAQAVNFASGMVGAKPLVVQEPPSPKNLHFDF